jgi:rubrerythrin
MEYIDMAMEVEKQGIDHYSHLADNCQVRELKGIFEFFMREEQRHYEIFDALQKNEKLPDVAHTDVKKRAREVFQQLTADIKSLGVPAIDHGDAYQKALTLEKNSISVYQNMLQEIEDEGFKKQLKFIIEQERFHLLFVQSLMELQRHPYEWLENAEWRHSVDY